MTIEIESLEAFDAHLDAAGNLCGVAVQGLDLCERTEQLLTVDVAEAVLLGCVVEASALRRLHADGALVFPPFRDLPFRAFRNDLYDAMELFDGYVSGESETLGDAFDSRVYRWFEAARRGHDVVDQLAQRIHDHAIDDALIHLLEERDRHQRVVAIMGGHGMERDEDGYRQVALLSRELTRRGMFCASGGGPGAMEATNLGAWMSAHGDEALGEALEVLGQAAPFEPVSRWLDAGLEVRRRWPRPEGEGESLGIPTWHYGHEPPNVFASHIAKYFANSIREEGLLAIALAGVVFAPGSAGTIQEIFQDATQNHYATVGVVSPMVFFGAEYWTKTKPVYPLVLELAEGHEYAKLLGIYDTVDEIVEHLVGHGVKCPKWASAGDAALTRARVEER